MATCNVRLRYANDVMDYWVDAAEATNMGLHFKNKVTDIKLYTGVELGGRTIADPPITPAGVFLIDWSKVSTIFIKALGD